jgi:hypothetical protein
LTRHGWLSERGLGSPPIIDEAKEGTEMKTKTPKTSKTTKTRKVRGQMPEVPVVLSETNAFEPQPLPKQAAPLTNAGAQSLVEAMGLDGQAVIVAGPKPAKPKPVSMYKGTDWAPGTKYSKTDLVVFLKSHAPRWGGFWTELATFSDTEIERSLAHATTRGGAQGQCMTNLRLRELHATSKAA